MSFLRKSWKWLTVDSEWGGRILLVLLIVAILFAAILLSGPKPENHMIVNTPRPPKTEFTATPSTVTTPPSVEYVQTTGVIVAVGAIIAVIVVGTLIEFRRHKDEISEKQDQ